MTTATPDNDPRPCKGMCGARNECPAKNGPWMCSLNYGHSQTTHVACGDGPDRHALRTWKAES